MKKLLFIFVVLFLLFYNNLAYAYAESPKLDNSFTFIYEDEKNTVDQQTIQSWSSPVTLPRLSNLIYQPPSSEDLLKQYVGQKSQTINEFIKYNFRPGFIYEYINQAALKLDSLPVEPELTVQNGRATSFVPPQDGLKLDVFQTTTDTLRALADQEKTVKITVAVAPPRQSLSETNDLGIKELVGRGESNFKGSPKNRRYNIKVGIEKFKGVVLKPGEEFSFNKNLGPVDGEHGFLPELVIKKEGTVPEFGGGLCQVSSTTFRAAMNAGLPIKERKNHAYAVVYYSPQGTDATIYPGSVDLKFVNDTPAHLLIWPYLKDDNNLVFDFYGTKDDRQVTLEKPVQWDRQPDGPMKASWTREVFKNGTTTTDTFKSVYQSPALFHKTEEFPKATTTPVSTAPLPTPSNPQ